MTEAQKTLFAAIALIVVGVGTLLFGGVEETGAYIEIMGFRIGRGERRPMSTAASVFWGIAAISAGIYLLRTP